MKTKIVYISGNELFNMSDIRAAFEEVRAALGLDSETVLFGVPVDNEDAGLCTDSESEEIEVDDSIEDEEEEEIEDVEESEEEIEDEEVEEEEVEEKPEEAPVKKRGRPRKTPITLESEDDEKTDSSENNEHIDEKIVPIISVLSGKEPDTAISEETIDITTESIEIDSITSDINEAEEIKSEKKIDLEALLSDMAPLKEDIIEETKSAQSEEEIQEELPTPDEVNVDATLKQLAEEFAETQNDIETETKSGARGKIAKLRNILPFKQSKRKDNGTGDLLEWGGLAANDEDFSIPGFFTNTASNK